MAIKEEDAAEFKTWIDELLRLAKTDEFSMAFQIDPVSDCGLDCWIEAFEFGESPYDALDTNRFYAMQDRV
jgi:hypothetical protein